jgi:nitrate reductase NapE component
MRSLGGAVYEKTFEDSASAHRWAAEGQPFFRDKVISYEVFEDGKLIEAKRSATADQEEEELRQYSALGVTVITFVILDLIVIAVVGDWGLVWGWIPTGLIGLMVGNQVRSVRLGHALKQDSSFLLWSPWPKDSKWWRW